VFSEESKELITRIFDPDPQTWITVQEISISNFMINTPQLTFEEVKTFFEEGKEEEKNEESGEDSDEERTRGEEEELSQPPIQYSSIDNFY